MNAAAVAHLGLVAGFFYYTWRRKPRYFNAWCCAVVLLASGILRLILDPQPTILLRVAAVCEVGVWLLWVTTHWGQSGLACWQHGHHVWITTIKTPTTILSWDSNDPSVDRRMRAGFYESSNSGTITDPACAVCGTPKAKDNQ